MSQVDIAGVLDLDLEGQRSTGGGLAIEWIGECFHNRDAGRFDCNGSIIRGRDVVAAVLGLSIHCDCVVQRCCRGRSDLAVEGQCRLSSDYERADVALVHVLAVHAPAGGGRGNQPGIKEIPDEDMS